VLGASASSSVPTTKIPAASISVNRRPNRSARLPATSAPTIAPSVTQLVMISMTMVVGWNSFWMPLRHPR
jgi:hypothetical protein